MQVRPVGGLWARPSPNHFSLSHTHTLINTGHVEILSQSALPGRVLNVVIYKQLSHSPKSSFLVSRDEFSGPLHFAV